MATVRPAGADDAGLLTDMLVLAAGWRPGSDPRSVPGVLADPHLAIYVDAWPRAGDFGVVAEVDGVPVGAAWARQFGGGCGGYGFVDASTPEVSVGVVATARGKGVERALLNGLINEARRRDVTQLSLSVERDNPALALYESLGFVEVGGDPAAATLLLTLGQR